MNKRYYFRQNEKNFIKWCRLIPQADALCRNYRHFSFEIREARKIEFEEMNLIMRQYHVLIKTLDDHQLDYLDKYCIHSKQPEWKMYDYTFEIIFKSWIDIVFPHGEGRLKQLDIKKFANSLKQARLDSYYTVEEVADLVGISPVTLRAYESGKRIIRIDIYYLLIQIFYNISFLRK